MSTPWLLLRGLMRETRHWGDFPAQLAAAGQTSTYTLDLAGNGLRYRETSGPTVPDMADDVADQWQRLRGGPVRVLALSLGGMVAAEWARQAPHTVTELVLCNSSFRPYSAPWERFQPRALSKLLRLLLTAPAALEIETEILRLSSNRPEAHAAQLCDWVQWRQQCPVSAGNVLRQLAAGKAVQVVALDAEISTQQAADLRPSALPYRVWGEDLIDPCLRRSVGETRAAVVERIRGAVDDRHHRRAGRVEGVAAQAQGGGGVGSHRRINLPGHSERPPEDRVGVRWHRFSRPARPVDRTSRPPGGRSGCRRRGRCRPRRADARSRARP